MIFSVLMTYDKTVCMTTFLVFLETREISYLFNINKYHKCEDTARHTHVKIHLSTVFYKCIVCFQAFERFSRHLKKVFYVQKFLATWLVKISFSLKDLQKHHQACSISSLFSNVKIRLTMTIER